MTHPRATIRQTFQAALTGTSGARPTTAGDRVYASRTVPLFPNMLPAILVFTPADERDPAAPQDGDGWCRHILTVVAEAATVVENADDQADTLAAEIEAVVNANPNLGGAVESIRWVQTDTEMSGDGEEPIVVARSEFEAVYYTAPPEEPAGTLPTFVYASWVPEIGPDHEDDYTDLGAHVLPTPKPHYGV
jgi:hypothetical protein